MWMKLIYPKWPKLSFQTEFHLPPHGPVVFAAEVPRNIELTFVDENREQLDMEDQPDLVALSVMLTTQIPRAKTIAETYRARGIPVIAGGISVMLHSEEMIEICDSVFLGEVEGLFEQVLQDFHRGELKKVYNFMDALPDISSVGTARREILDYSHYVYRGTRMLDLVHASRGCHFNCYPCAVAFLGGRCFRPRPFEKVVEEISTIENNRLFFVDNSLAQDDEWEKNLFRALIPLKRKWVSHPIKEDDEILDLAYQAGCWYVYQAIFDTSDTIRNRIKRYKDHGIGVEGTILLGTDDQDEDCIKRLVDFLLEIDLDMAEFTVLTPYPHTRVRQDFEQQGRIFDNNWEHYTCDRVVFEPKQMTVNALEKMLEYSWEHFYGAIGKQTRMGRLFRGVIEREVEDGTSRRFRAPRHDMAAGS